MCLFRLRGLLYRILNYGLEIAKKSVSYGTLSGWHSSANANCQSNVSGIITVHLYHLVEGVMRWIIRISSESTVKEFGLPNSHRLEKGWCRAGCSCDFPNLNSRCVSWANHRSKLRFQLRRCWMGMIVSPKEIERINVRLDFKCWDYTKRNLAQEFLERIKHTLDNEYHRYPPS